MTSSSKPCTMKLHKIISICLLALASLACNAQRITNSSYNTLGYIKSDGTVQDGSYRTVGYIKSDGTVQNSSYNTVGYIKSDGTVQNSSYRTIGYVKSDGTVQDASYRTIGHASGIPKRWTAFYFFFLDKVGNR